VDIQWNDNNASGVMRLDIEIHVPDIGPKIARNALL
jgi:hypothetical protein